MIITPKIHGNLYGTLYRLAMLKIVTNNETHLGFSDESNFRNRYSAIGLISGEYNALNNMENILEDILITIWTYPPIVESHKDLEKNYG